MAKNISRSIIPNRSLIIKPINRNTVSELAEIENSNQFSYVAMEEINPNDPIYISAGLAYKADDRPCDYIATSYGNIGAEITCINRGRFGFDGTNGLDLWNLDGVLSNTMPTKSNVFYQRLGKMLSADIVELNIESGAWNV